MPTWFLDCHTGNALGALLVRRRVSLRHSPKGSQYSEHGYVRSQNSRSMAKPACNAVACCADLQPHGLQRPGDRSALGGTHTGSSPQEPFRTRWVAATWWWWWWWWTDCHAGAAMLLMIVVVGKHQVHNEDHLAVCTPCYYY